VCSALSEGMQKGQELVWWTIASRSAPERLSFGECLFLQFKVGMKPSEEGILLAHARTPSGQRQAGLMFWFTRKKLVGSYFFLMVARRS
jgi:hypothetical protein